MRTDASAVDPPARHRGLKVVIVLAALAVVAAAREAAFARNRR